MNQFKFFHYPIPTELWSPIGDRLQKRLGLHENFAKLSKIQVIISSIVQVFNDSHAKFRIKYANHDQQIMVANQIIRRLNTINPFQDNEIDFPFALDTFRANDEWQTFTLGDLYDMQERLPIRIPQYSNEEVLSNPNNLHLDLINLCLGTYRFHRACLYITLIKKYLLQEETFESQEAYLTALQEWPWDFKLFYRHLMIQPEGWDNDLHGNFPRNGLGIIGGSIPSGNRRSEIITLLKS